MQVIDFHIHAGKFSLLRDDIQNLLLKRPMEPWVDFRLPFSDPEHLKPYLGSRGVTKCIVLAECGPGTNFSIDSELVVNFCKDQEMLIPYGSINPHYHDTVKEFWKSLELGIEGFKFYPADHSFDPKMDSMMEVYGLCERFSMPIMFHTGFTAQRDANEAFIRPSDFEFIAQQFPSLPLILAHSGRPHWYDEAFEMAARYPNVYIETALVDPTEWAEVYKNVDHISDKIFFASDWPVAGSYQVLMDKALGSGLPEPLLNAMMFHNANHFLQQTKRKQEEALAQWRSES